MKFRLTETVLNQIKFHFQLPEIAQKLIQNYKFDIIPIYEILATVLKLSCLQTHRQTDTRTRLQNQVFPTQGGVKRRDL